MARLFTVVISTGTAQRAGTDDIQDIYECDFAGLHFSRQHEFDLIHWVRIAARNAYGRDTQVIFLHERTRHD
jgi:hypothetical protein